MDKRLPREFFERDVLDVAPDLLGKYLVRRFDSGDIHRFQITEVEAYRGEEDKACHAAKGRTKRTEVLYREPGTIYVYLIYGMYWLLNVVTGEKDCPQAVLIRGVKEISGPGRIGKFLKLDASFYGESFLISDRLWFEDSDDKPLYKTTPRIGIDYAGEWRDLEWRFVVDEDSK